MILLITSISTVALSRLAIIQYNLLQAYAFYWFLLLWQQRSCTASYWVNILCTTFHSITTYSWLCVYTLYIIHYQNLYFSLPHMYCSIIFISYFRPANKTLLYQMDKMNFTVAVNGVIQYSKQFTEAIIISRIINIQCSKYLMK